MDQISREARGGGHNYLRKAIIPNIFTKRGRLFKGGGWEAISRGTPITFKLA